MHNFLLVQEMLHKEIQMITRDSHPSEQKTGPSGFPWNGRTPKRRKQKEAKLYAIDANRPMGPSALAWRTAYCCDQEYNTLNRNCASRKLMEPVLFVMEGLLELLFEEAETIGIA